jgi:hypothetical protein
MDEALPKLSSKHGRIASKTSGNSGLVALLSRYTLRMKFALINSTASAPMPPLHAGRGW